MTTPNEFSYRLDEYMTSPRVTWYRWTCCDGCLTSGDWTKIKASAQCFDAA